MAAPAGLDIPEDSISSKGRSRSQLQRSQRATSTSPMGRIVPEPHSMSSKDSRRSSKSKAKTSQNWCNAALSLLEEHLGTKFGITDALEHKEKGYSDPHFGF